MTVLLNFVSQISRSTRVESTLAREALAEFLGSFILIVSEFPGGESSADKMQSRQIRLAKLKFCTT
jgi:hypothetical protein